ncbi:MAG TPA: DEAD/DEAH box helicase, partial [Pirellulales bacterium]|nr:DEAD/DEAH box helicase [Pirellulales bacterium]
MHLDGFHPLVRQWFSSRFGQPTDPQQRGWPEIVAGRNTLIAAPTGSGKTLAAFLVCLDRLLRRWLDGTLEEKIYVVYVSPLKALGNDIHRNLEIPLAEIGELAAAAGYGPLPIRAVVRTGDTPAQQRQKMLRHPPHILVTTPESLYLLLTSQKSRQLLGSVETIIVDEIHALVRDKRGSHLALSLERLEALCPRPPVRIGLSATQRPIDLVAQFLVGTDRVDPAGQPDCSIIDGGHFRDLDLRIEVPPSELSAVCSHEQWAEIHTRLTELIAEHRSTLIFVNSRRLAERIAHHLRELLGSEAVASHHGSLSREIRQSAEQRLKAGELKAIVATASLEMGIDIGYIDLVCQIGSPRAIATFLQRVGRAGHSLGKIPKGRLIPLTRDELVESLALIRAVHRGQLDRVEIPEQPLDILAQQIVASVACEEWDEDALLDLCRRAWPFRQLAREDFDAIVRMLSEGIVPGSRRGTYLHRDAIHRRLRARRGARLAALTSGGAIPETAQYRVIAEPDGTFVGTVDEDFAVESLAGDVFLLGNTSWRVQHVRGGEVRVHDAHGAPPSIPFWLGEAPGRTPEFSAELSRLRGDLARALPQGKSGDGASAWLQSECGATPWAAEQALAYVETQLAAVGLVPTSEEIMFERFFDESGGMQLVIHAPLGARINRAWGLALRKRFCRSFDFELQASADNDGIVLSLGPQHSVPIENLFRMLNAENVAGLLEQSLLAVPMFQVRWRWNLTRSLVVLRQQGGKRVPPHIQRFRSDDLLA